jgi:hypothetical protein
MTARLVSYFALSFRHHFIEGSDAEPVAAGGL